RAAPAPLRERIRRPGDAPRVDDGDRDPLEPVRHRDDRDRRGAPVPLGVGLLRGDDRRHGRGVAPPRAVARRARGGVGARRGNGGAARGRVPAARAAARSGRRAIRAGRGGGAMNRYWRDCGPLLGTLRFLRRALVFAMHRAATALWRTALAELGEGSLVQARVAIEHPRRVRIGRGCLVTSGARLTSELPEGELRLADRVQVNQGARLDHTGGLTLLSGALV